MASVSLFSKSWRRSRDDQSLLIGALPNATAANYGATTSQTRPHNEVATRRIKILRLTNLALMSLVLMGYGCCLSLFAPFFPTEAIRRDVSSTAVGFIYSTFPFLLFLGTLITGLLIRTLGLTFMIGSGTLLAGGTTILFGMLDWAPPGDSYVILCFFVRGVEGAGAGLYNTAAYSIAAQLFPQDIATVYAVLETANRIGQMIGPSIGGLLYNAGGFALPFFVMGFLLLIVGTISMIVLKMTMSEDAGSAIDGGKDQRDQRNEAALPWSHFFKTSVEIWLLTIVLAVNAVTFCYPQPTLAIYFEKLGLANPATVGLVFLGGSLIFTLLSLASGKLADSYPKRIYQLMFVGSVILIVSFIFFGPMPPLQSTVAPSIVLTITCHVLLCAGTAMILNAVPAAIVVAARAVGYKDGLDTSAMVATVFNAQWFLGLFAGGPIAGLLLDTVGFEWGAFVMALLSMVVAVLLFVGIIVHRLKTQRLLDHAIVDGVGKSAVDKRSQNNHEEEEESLLIVEAATEATEEDQIMERPPARRPTFQEIFDENEK